MNEAPIRPGPPAERRRQPRYRVNIPATIRISTYGHTVPFDFKGAVICDLSEMGVGVSLTVETTVTREEMMKIIVRRRSCYVHCQLPGQNSGSELYGEIAWVEPHVTSEGTLIRFGVSLNENYPGNQNELRSFIRGLDSANAS